MPTQATANWYSPERSGGESLNIRNDEDDYCGSDNGRCDKLYYIWDPEKMSMTEFITCHSNAADIRWWYLDEWSCVKILRDRIWFQNALPKILVVMVLLSFALYNSASGLVAFPRFTPRGPPNPSHGEVFVPPNAAGPPVISKIGMIG